MRWPLVIRRVKGISMLPTLSSNQIIIATGLFKSLKVGDVVIVRKDNIEIIKRINKIDSNKIFIVGDNNKESIDSRKFGWVNEKSVVARVIQRQIQNHEN